MRKVAGLVCAAVLIVIVGACEERPDLRRVESGIVESVEITSRAMTPPEVEIAFEDGAVFRFYCVLPLREPPVGREVTLYVMPSGRFAGWCYGDRPEPVVRWSDLESAVVSDGTRTER